MTLKLHRLGVSPLPRRSLSSTSHIELCLFTVWYVACNFLWPLRQNILGACVDACVLINFTLVGRVDIL